MIKVDYLKEFTAKLQSLDRSKRTYDVFRDFLILSTCALAQKRKILEIISDEITYKDKTFNVKLKPIFQTIAENQYNLAHDFSNNRTLENGIIVKRQIV